VLKAFAAWTAGHVLLIGGYRISEVLQGKRKANSFPSGEKHGGPDWYQRVNRAHANCVENLPVFASVVLVNYVTQGPTIDSLAQAYLVARIGQSLCHWYSSRNLVINIRFAFFAAQLVLLAVMGMKTVNLM